MIREPRTFTRVVTPMDDNEVLYNSTKDVQREPLKPIEFIPADIIPLEIKKPLVEVSGNVDFDLSSKPILQTAVTPLTTRIINPVATDLKLGTIKPIVTTTVRPVRPVKRIIEKAKKATIVQLTSQDDIKTGTLTSQDDFKTGTLTLPKYSITDIYGSAPDNGQRAYYDSIKNDPIKLESTYQMVKKVQGTSMGVDLPTEQLKKAAEAGNLADKLSPNLLTPITIGKTDWVKNGAQQKLTKALKTGDVQATQEAINKIKERDNIARENLLVDKIATTNDPVTLENAKKQLEEKTFIDPPMTKEEVEKIFPPEEEVKKETEEVKKETKEKIKLGLLDQLVEYIYQIIYN